MCLRDIEVAAREQGFIVTRTPQGHPKFIPPNATKVVIGAAGHLDARSLLNLLAQLCCAGLVWPATQHAEE